MDNQLKYLANNIELSRDSLLTPWAISMLKDFYLLPHETSPQQGYSRATTAWSVFKGKRNEELSQRLYDYVSRKWFMFASPVLSNAPEEGVKHRGGQPISCFLGYVPDTVPGLIDHTSELRWLSIMGGGVGGHWSDVRSISDIAPGPIPFLHTVDSDMTAYKQGRCYTPETELLTDRGWVRFDCIHPEDRVAQVDENQLVSFVKPMELVKEYHSGYLLNIKDKKNLDFMVTPDHSMVIDRRTKDGWGKLVKIRAADLPTHSEVGMSFSGYSSIAGDGLTSSEKLSITFQADGYLESGGSVSFHSHKDRKREQMLELLSDTKWTYTTNYGKDNSTTIRIKLKGELYTPQVETSKDFSWVKPHTRSLKWCEEFLEQARLWDASERGAANSFTYCNTNKEAAEVVFTVATLAGKQVKIKENYREEPRKAIYTVYISDSNHFTTQKVEKIEVPYEGYVYCATVPTGMLLVRRNGKSLICGNTRKGSYAAYLNVDHPDIIEFMQLRVPTGDANRKALNLHNAINFTDSFMHAVIAGEKYQLIDPKTGPTGEWLEARQVFERWLEVRFRTGEPYGYFIDTANRALPESQKQLGLKSHGSNLCSEITLATNEERTAVCCLSSVNLELYDEWKDTTMIADLIEMLDNVLEYFIENAPDTLKKAKFSASQERAVGLGAMGFHSYLQRHGIAWESQKARLINVAIFEDIQKKAIRASLALGSIRGEAPDMIGTGRRNSHLLAIAPNASSGIIIGTSPSILPNRANAYTHRTRGGSFLIKNVYLENYLRQTGYDTDEVWTSIITNGGSVAHLGFIPDDIKDVYKTSTELNQMSLVDHAADRQPYICQAQSLDTFFRSGESREHVRDVHLYAWLRGLKSVYYLRTESKQKAERVSDKVKEDKLEDNNETVIYGKPGCSYCKMATALFDARNIDYKYVDIVELGKTAAEVTGRPDVRSLPQIYIDGEYIGGFDEAYKYLTASDEEDEGEATPAYVQQDEVIPVLGDDDGCRACEG